MMREIKFRAWHKPFKKTKFGSEFVYGAKAFDFWNMSPDDYTLEQFTGLHDKNGKEVYEGDIVNCSEGCPHKIIWVQEHGGMFIGGMPGWYLSGLKDGYAWGEDEEVIGNIHENPELLEVK
ncbi:DNA-packaging protein [Fructobacillus tropaeoli]|uniref:YopX family protein n=1 Tax=Fructobacillus tropaeoli TaxID=709323 RepID=UPI001455EEBB|nr:YopX family protein [Fructobacillus tropaeoli]NLS38678.1 DNA-packaging protein [Fructobacillus tropaeoli]